MSTLAFNNYAADYDSHFTQSAIGMLQRKRVFKFLLPLLGKQKQVLEINCGTGYDALAIAPKVKAVLATDISPDMIAVAENKKRNSAASNVSFMVADIRELHKQLHAPFDLLFSDFGGLNCLSPEELGRFAKNISPFISANGRLALVIMGKKCIWENLFFMKQNDKRFGRRNTLTGIETRLGEHNFKTYYYSPGQIAELFGPLFTVKITRPIGLCIPPSYLNSYFLNKKRWLSALNLCEKVLARFSFLSNYADHYIIVLKKNNGCSV